LNLEELNHHLPNGFHDVKLLSIKLDYLAGTAMFHMSFWAGSMSAPPGPGREQYREGIVSLSGLCFCSIEPPDPDYPFLPNGKAIDLSGDLQMRIICHHCLLFRYDCRKVRGATASL